MFNNEKRRNVYTNKITLRCKRFNSLNSLNNYIKTFNRFLIKLQNFISLQNWEDVFDGSLCYLLRTNLAKSAKDKLRAAQASFDEVKDISKLEKHLYQVLERVAKCQGSAPISEDNDANLESTDDTLHDNNGDK